MQASEHTVAPRHFCLWFFQSILYCTSVVGASGTHGFDQKAGTYNCSY